MTGHGNLNGNSGVKGLIEKASSLYSKTKHMKRLLLFAVLTAVLFSSCDFFHGRNIRGNGNVTTETRDFSNFNIIEVASAIDLYVKQDSAYSVKVQIDEDLQPYILITQDGGTLRVRQERNTNLDATGRIKVYVSTPDIRQVGASGACKLFSENMLVSAESIGVHLSGASHARLDLKAPGISVEMSGASSIALKGETKDFILEGSGASHAKCYDLMTENANVDVSGASSTEVFASVKLDADASGASHIRYRGNASVSKHESGASKVTKAD